MLEHGAGQKTDADAGSLTFTIALAANAEDREAPFGFDRGWSLSWAAGAVACRPSIGVSDAEDHSNAGVSVVELDAVEMVEF